MSLAPARKIEAVKLRADGLSWVEVAHRIGCGLHVLRCELQDGFKEKRNMQVRRYRMGFAPLLRRKRRVAKTDKPSAVFDIPREVLAERDARMALEPQSITAALCGDPPVCRSALYMRNLGK